MIDWPAERQVEIYSTHQLQVTWEFSFHFAIKFISILTAYFIVTIVMAGVIGLFLLSNEV